jgi:PAS domain S-box-containing protein
MKKSSGQIDNLQLREIMQALPLGVHQYELRKDMLVFIGGNKAADHILGIHHDDLIGKTIEEAFPSLAATDVPIQYKKIAVSGKGWEAEQINYHDQQISGVFQVYAFQTAPGKMAAVFRDITEKKKAEISVQESEQKLRMLFDNMAQGVVYLNAEGEITAVNPSACKILGYSRDEFLQLKNYETGLNALKEDGSPLSPEEIPSKKVLLTGKPIKNTIVRVYNSRFKKNQWLLIDAIPEHKPGETVPFRAFISFSDITELKEKNIEFARLNQEFENQNEQLKKTNIRLEETNARILEISRRIKDNEEQLRIILENSKDIIYSINYAKRIFEYISPVVKEILGKPVTDFLNQSPDILFNLMHPDDIQQFGNHWIDIIDLEEKEIFLFEIGYRLIDLTGTYHWMSESNKLLRDEKGNPLYLIGSIRDITDIKNAEFSLKKSEERLSLAIEATSQGLWDINRKNNIHYFSPRCFSMLGYEPGEIPFTSDTIFSLVHPEEKELLMKKMFDFRERNENPFLIEFRIKHKSGEYIWFASHGKCVERDEKGSSARITGTFTDITERKKFELALKQKNEELLTAEEELRAINDELMTVNEKQERQNKELLQTYEKLMVSEERFKQLADNIEDIFWLREGFRLIYLSPSFEKIFGLNQREAMMNPNAIRAVIHPEDLSACRIFADLKTYENDGPLTENFRIHKPDGSVRWIWSRIFPIYDDKGKIYRVAGIASDITMQKNLENELRMAKDKAQESDRLKSTFLANISHEIRTPMNGIIGFANLLTRSDINDENRSRYIEVVNKSSDQLLHIIDDLIDISKIEANQLQISMSPCDVNAMIDEIHTIYFRVLKQIGKEHIELIPIYTADEANAIIMTDGLRLRQIMNNLMNNAVKFTENGFIRFGYEFENQDHIRFFVEDSGIGIDPSMKEIVFMPFRQADEGDARKYGGTGLGLPLSRGLVRMLKGELWLDSMKEKGTTVSFSIPVETVALKTENLPAENDEERKMEWSNKKILVVEDDELNFEFLYALLEPTTVTIERAKDGIQAVNLCKEKEFDLVLMDIRLPGVDGLKATRQLREMGYKLPIIAQTAYAMANDRDRCLEAGCDDYIPKPIKHDTLIGTLTKYLSD